ncbi:MAG TPA: hypothetical protein VJW73_13835 [Gemmatimonadaceae bacterium]|nr:hypothetical protein [Gemmatimonadaceae bacterium]
MTTSDARPTSASSAATPPIEAWLTPIVVAALARDLVSNVGTAMMYIVYYRHRWGTRPNTMDGPMTLTSFFSVRTLLFSIAWSLLFGLSYREWPALRRLTDRASGMAGVGILYGTLLWALMHFAIFPHKLGETPEEVLGWLSYCLLTGLPVVWAVRRFSPLAPSRPIFARTAGSPESGRRQIMSGIAIAVPALLCLYWLTTPGAGFLMILALFVGLGAIGVLAIATSLILGGIWTRFGLPGLLVVRLSPLLLAAAGAWSLFGR